jgi:hypothetical protein
MLCNLINHLLLSTVINITHLNLLEEHKVTGKARLRVRHSGQVRLRIAHHSSITEVADVEVSVVPVVAMMHL